MAAMIFPNGFKQTSIWYENVTPVSYTLPTTIAPNKISVVAVIKTESFTPLTNSKIILPGNINTDIMVSANASIGCGLELGIFTQEINVGDNPDDYTTGGLERLNSNFSYNSGYVNIARVGNNPVSFTTSGSHQYFYQFIITAFNNSGNSAVVASITLKETRAAGLLF